jgi:hypothetical protein
MTILLALVASNSEEQSPFSSARPPNARKQARKAGQKFRLKISDTIDLGTQPADPFGASFT